MLQTLTLGLVLVQALAFAQASLLSRTHQGNDVGALCADKSVDLTTFSQLRQLGQAVGRSSSSCSSTLKVAISELVELIESGKQDLCSEKSINALRAYYNQYLDTSSTSSAGESKKVLPKSLQKFVLAYGMQMSNLCKKNMIQVLSTEGSSLVDASDFEQLGAIIKDDGPVAQVLGAMGGPGEVFLPGDLVPFFKKHGVKLEELGGDKLVLQTSTSDYIKQMQSVCQHRFKPVYAPLMMPLVRLVNMGFDYKDEPLKADLASPEIVRDVARWSRIVFLCEAIANVRVVEAEENDQQQQADGSPSNLVRILTPEEADAIELAAQHQSKDSESDSSSAISDVVYTPHNKVTLADDEIYNKADKQLKKAIKSFKTSRGEEYILRKRVTKKGLELIKKQLKSGHFGFIFSAAWKGMMRRGKSVNSPTKQLVETLNEMVEQQQAGPSSSSADGAISLFNLTIGNRHHDQETVQIILFTVIATVILTFAILGGTGVLG